jgi:hypothetical protein
MTGDWAPPASDLSAITDSSMSKSHATGNSGFRTASELKFEQWCQEHRIKYRRIREAIVPGHQRPDYWVKVGQLWWVIEVEEIFDKSQLQDESKAYWLKPGHRLCQSIKDAAGQLRKFSHREFPTVVCFFDTTIGFYLEHDHVMQAMFGQETLKFEVSDDPQHQPRFLGRRFGKKATLTRNDNTSISAVAVLLQPSDSNLEIHLYRNPHARVSIPDDLETSLIPREYRRGTPSLAPLEPSIIDFRKRPDRQEWFDHPVEKGTREIEKCLRELGTGHIRGQ